MFSSSESEENVKEYVMPHMSYVTSQLEFVTLHLGHVKIEDIEYRAFDVVCMQPHLHVCDHILVGGISKVQLFVLIL